MSPLSDRSEPSAAPLAAPAPASSTAAAAAPAAAGPLAGAETARQLQVLSHRGYGAPVNTWNGTHSAMSRQVEKVARTT